MKGDFLGFTFKTGNGTYTSEQLGFIRTSDGDRYNETIPEIEDKTVEIPGLDGSYFYGSNFKNRQFSIKIAFDEMTEKQFRLFKKVFGYKHTGELIFDEAPYKKYLVKVASAPELEYVCFDEKQKTLGSQRDGIRPIHQNVTIMGNNNEETTVFTRTGVEQVIPYVYTGGTHRIYKGEGTIEFIAYFPFAKSVYKTLDLYDNENKNEWASASKLKNSLSGYDTWNSTTEEIIVYNAGDIETGFRLYIPFPYFITTTLVNGIEEQQKTYTDNCFIQPFELSYMAAALNVSSAGNSIKRKDGDNGIIIDTTNGLIEGALDNYVTTGNLYNEYATGEFFKIQPNNLLNEDSQKIKLTKMNNIQETVEVSANHSITHTLVGIPSGNVEVQGANRWEEGTDDPITYTLTNYIYTISNNSNENVRITFNYTANIVPEINYDYLYF